MSDNNNNGDVDAARVDMDAARLDVVESEKEIQEIKNLLRQVTSSTDQGKRSTIAVSVLKVSTLLFLEFLPFFVKLSIFTSIIASYESS
jgi:hypothetical protein